MKINYKKSSLQQENPANSFSCKELNNRGASLLLVIIAFLFIATLGTIIVSAAVKNIEMKAVDKKTKENFYSAEAALDEIKAGLTEKATDKITVAYSEALSKYSTTNAAMRTKLFNNTFTDGMKSVLSVKLDSVTNTDIIEAATLSGYLQETKYNDVTKIGAKVISNAIWEVTEGQYITLKNVKVQFFNGDYTASVTTDIKIIYPNASFQNLNGYVEATPFIKYALIAQDSLWAWDETSSHTITGSVYAGVNGININSEGNTLTLKDGRFISAGNIMVKDKANLIVEGIDSEVWATNLITTQGDKAVVPSKSTTIKITGTTYIKDDLVIDAKNSEIELSGQYYGYSSSDNTAEVSPTSDNNSAITVNADHASLKLKGLSKLYLAGRAFIRMNDRNVVDYNNDPVFMIGDNANTNILTGESISVKGSQQAYLLPSDYIAVGHNPISWDEYTSYYNSVTPLVNIPSDSVIFRNPMISAQESKMSYYLNSVEPYKKVFYKFGVNSNMVYYYLNFETEEKATTYLKNFRICYPDVVYNGFPIKDIILNDASGAVVSAGNLITYENNDFQIMNGNNGEYINNYATQYSNLSQTLQKFAGSTKSLFDTLINSNVIHSGAPSGGQAFLIDGANYINVFNGDVVLNQVNKSGIIIATGDVTVNQSFTGMIIAGGKIKLYGGANITAAPALVTSLINNYIDLKKYFVELNAPEQAINQWENINVSDLIVYNNWQKN